MIKNQIQDQSAHFIAAICILLLTQIGLLGFILGGFLIGFVREQGQYWIKDRPIAWKFWLWGKGPWFDIVFWTLGGLVAGLLV
jgi:hypothetical protein